MSNTKKFNNNRYTSSGEGSLAENQYQQNSPQQTRKQTKYQNSKNNANKYYSKNHNNYSYKAQNEVPTVVEKRIEIPYQTNDANIMVPSNESHQNPAYVQSNDQSLTECKDEMLPAFSPSTESNSSDNATDDQEQSKQEVPFNVYDQGLQAYVPCNGQITEPSAQVDVNGSCYNAAYEYDYQQSNVQQQSQYYIYQPYQDYSQVPNIAGTSQMNNGTPGTPQQQQHYYQTYQPMPSYIYDPQTVTYTSAYSPVQQTGQQAFQQTPGNNTNLSSPQQHQQQPSAFLASYQTPPQPAHQLYIQTSNITPPTSLSPNDTPSTNSSGAVSTDRQSNCNSPHPNQNGVVPSHLAQTPVHNQYVMYNPEHPGGMPQNQYTLPPQQQTNVYTPMTPQTYQCNSPLPTPQFMMYNPPPQVAHGSPFHTGPNSPMIHSPYKQQLGTPNSNTTPKYNKYRTNKFNNNSTKRNFSQKFNTYTEQTPQSSYSMDENMYMNSPVGANSTEFIDPTQTSPESQMPMYPTSSYCDPNMGMPNTETILNAAYQNYDNIDSYGDDYGDDYDNGTGDNNDENLACQVCRGRRMCFCYFLKVRYYKFPSFFDLVDHQYKKWRKTMAQNQLMQQQQQQMNSPNGSVNMMNQSQNNLMAHSPSINTNVLPKKA